MKNIFYLDFVCYNVQNRDLNTAIPAEAFFIRELNSPDSLIACEELSSTEKILFFQLNKKI